MTRLILMDLGDRAIRLGLVTYRSNTWLYQPEFQSPTTNSADALPSRACNVREGSHGEGFPQEIRVDFVAGPAPLAIVGDIRNDDRWRGPGIS